MNLKEARGIRKRRRRFPRAGKRSTIAQPANLPIRQGCVLSEEPTKSIGLEPQGGARDPFLAPYVRFVHTQTFALRTAIARLAPCASSTRKRYRLFGYKPHFRVGAGSPGADRYRFARFGECGFYLKNTMHLLRILWNSSECLPHKADAHVGDVTR